MMNEMSDCSHFTGGLEETLAEISRIAPRLQDDWWIIGSAAIALARVAIEVPHVDLLLSERDARSLLKDWAPAKIVAAGQERFRSVYGEHAGSLIPIEIMGGLELNVEGEWVPVTPTTRLRIELTGGPVYTPDVADQLALLLMFRRPQDLVRAEMLMSLRA
jgi:hypothetical protein